MGLMKQWLGRLGAGAGVAGLALTLATPGAAHADLATPKGASAGETTSDGYRAVAVDLRYDYDPGLALSLPRPPALCWWEEWPGTPYGDATDPEDVKDYWFERGGRPTGHAYAGLLSVDSEDEFDRAIDAETRGDDVTWYSMRTNGAPTDLAGRAEVLTKANCTHQNPTRYDGEPVMVTLRWFPAGNPPEPKIDPEVLAEYAYRVMRLEEPTLEWNPKIRVRAGAAMVNLPTWVWVDDTDSVGVRQVQATAGDVTVTVVARTDGIRVSWPDGARSCTSDRATQQWAPGVPESQACTVEFTRTSGDEGIAVRTRSEWRAEWTSNTGDSGDLPGRALGAVTTIRVASSQALVTEVN